MPVTIIDDSEVIIGYYPKKLIPALKLDVSVDLSGKTQWLAEKYDGILRATVRANNQFSQEQLDTVVPLAALEPARHGGAYFGVP